MTQSRTRLALLAAALTTFATLGCKSEISSGAGLADGLTGDVGISFRDEVEAALGALTLGSALDPIGTTQAAADCGLRQGRTLCQSVLRHRQRRGRGPGRRHLPLHRSSLPVHRLARRHARHRGAAPDPGSGPLQAGFGYEATITGLRSRFTSADGKLIYDVTRNGTAA